MKNNFQLVRLFAALLVFYGHAFAFLNLPLPAYKHWLGFRAIAIFIFFTMSGYLIAERWHADPHIGRFLMRRVVRIFPGLIVCVTLTALVLGPFATTLPLVDYFKHSRTWHYIVDNIHLHTTYGLPGVFVNNHKTGVNGNIWSLPLEFLMYFSLAIVGLQAYRNRFVFLLVALVCAAMAFGAQDIIINFTIYKFNVKKVFLCGAYFWIGALFWVFDLKRFFSIPGVILAFGCLVIAQGNKPLLQMVAYVAFPYIVLSFGESAASKFTIKLNGLTNLSYGIYLYSFPIQQLIIMLNPNISLGLYLITSLLAILPVAFFSWKFVESPALRWKPKEKRGWFQERHAIPLSYHWFYFKSKMFFQNIFSIKRAIQ